MNPEQLTGAIFHFIGDTPEPRTIDVDGVQIVRLPTREFADLEVMDEVELTILASFGIWLEYDIVRRKNCRFTAGT